MSFFKQSILFVLSALGASAMNVQLINFNASTTKADTTPVVDAAGVLVPKNTGFIIIGTASATTIGNMVTAATQMNLPGFRTLLDSFTRYGASGITNNGGVVVTNFNINDGRYNITLNTANAPSSFTSNDIYTIIGNGTSAADSTQWGIMKHPGTWPVDGGASPGAVTASLVVADASLQSGILVGSLSANTVNMTLGGVAVDLRPWQLANLVPEPTTVTLAAFSALGLLRRRRA